MQLQTAYAGVKHKASINSQHPDILRHCPNESSIGIQVNQLVGLDPHNFLNLVISLWILALIHKVGPQPKLESRRRNGRRLIRKLVRVAWYSLSLQLR